MMTTKKLNNQKTRKKFDNMSLNCVFNIMNELWCASSAADFISVQRRDLQMRDRKPITTVVNFIVRMHHFGPCNMLPLELPMSPIPKSATGGYLLIM